MYLTWLLTAIFNFLVQIPIKLLGLLTVAIGLPFVKSFPETERAFSQFPAELKWKLVRLPSWLLWWDNQYDGLLGDKRGYWNDQCLKKYNKSSDSPWCMWLWTAVRNPANYFGRNVISMDVARCRVEKVWGDDVVIEEPGKQCRQFLKATRDDGKEFCRMFISWALPFNKERAFMLDIGYKIKLSHNELTLDAPDKDRLRSPVFVISPWKTLR